MKNFTALIVSIAYTIASYLAWKFVLPLLAAVITVSSLHHTEFPSTLLHGFIVVFLWAGSFCLFLTGLFIWVWSIRKTGALFWDRVFRSKTGGSRK